MNCKKFREMINEYLDNRLEADKISIVEKHIKECPECKSYADRYKKFRAAINKTEKKSAPEYLWTRINARLEEKEREEGILGMKKRVLFRHSWVWGLASIFIITAAIYFYSGRIREARYEMVNNYMDECIDCFAGEGFTDEYSYGTLEDDADLAFFLEDIFVPSENSSEGGISDYNGVGLWNFSRDSFV